MSLKILPIPPVPKETAHVVRACFPHGTLVIQLRDALGTLYSDEDFADVFPARGQPAEAPWRLALVTVLHWSPYCMSWKGYPTDRRQMRCAAGWIGSMPSVWN
jgi:hypothetical protein